MTAIKMSALCYNNGINDSVSSNLILLCTVHSQLSRQDSRQDLVSIPLIDYSSGWSRDSWIKRSHPRLAIVKVTISSTFHRANWTLTPTSHSSRHHSSHRATRNLSARDSMQASSSYPVSSPINSSHHQASICSLPLDSSHQANNNSSLTQIGKNNIIID